MGMGLGGLGRLGKLGIPAPSDGAADIITSIFADGTDGFYFDFSKTDRLFQNLSNTPADDAGENIYLGLESHAWGGKTLAEVVASATERVTNGTFDSDVSGWSPQGGSGDVTFTWDAGRMSIARGAGGIAGYPGKTITLTSGKTYRVSVDVVSGTGNLRLISGSTSDIALSAGTLVRYVTAGAASSTLGIWPNGSTTLVVDNISVKEIPGNHGLQATTSAQPKWQTGGLARFDGSDDHWLTPLLPGTAMTYLFKAKPSADATIRIMAGSNATTSTRSLLGFDAGGLFCGGVGAQTVTTIKGSTNWNGQTGVFGMVYDGSTVTLYENAAVSYSAAQSGGPNTTIPVAVGAQNANGTPATFFAGDTYYALAIKKALTAAEIAAITSKWGTS